MPLGQRCCRMASLMQQNTEQQLRRSRVTPDLKHILCGEQTSPHQSNGVRTVSSSVAAGLPIQEKPMTLKAPLSISPSSPGKLELAGKYAKKLGLCQWVMPAYAVWHGA